MPACAAHLAPAALTSRRRTLPRQWQAVLRNLPRQLWQARLLRICIRIVAFDFHWEGRGATKNDLYVRKVIFSLVNLNLKEKFAGELPFEYLAEKP